MNANKNEGSFIEEHGFSEEAVEGWMKIPAHDLADIFILYFVKVSASNIYIYMSETKTLK